MLAVGRAGWGESLAAWGLDEGMTATGETGDDFGRELIQELVGTGLALIHVIEFLREGLADEDVAGRDVVTVLLDALVDRCRAAIEAAGEEGCRAATELVVAIGDGVGDDLLAMTAVPEAG